MMMTPAACPHCSKSGVRPTHETPYVQYYRCADCGHVWNLPKPRFTATGIPTDPPTTSRRDRAS